jgi:small GTP-binding protein
VIRKKVCMLGAFAAGKTSLVERFVRGIFSAKYLSTVGVKIDKTTVVVGDVEIQMILWDLAGEDEFQRIQPSYLRGASGYLLVVDGTREETLDAAFSIRQRVEREVGPIPFVGVMNKIDLEDEWEIGDASLSKLEAQEWTTVMTSAKTGDGVRRAFQTLAEGLVNTS